MNLLRELQSIGVADRPKDEGEFAAQGCELHLATAIHQVISKLGQGRVTLAEGEKDLCLDCGDPISAARRSAEPATRLCTFCKERSDENHCV